jgi:hypothetical protein
MNPSETAASSSARTEFLRRTGYTELDLAIFAAAQPEEAKSYFDESLVDAFTYSWRSLAAIVDEIPTGLDFESVEAASRGGWLRGEFRNWGYLFLSAWLSSNGKAPLLCKLYSPIESQWGVPSAHWRLGDSPRVYRLEELALQERLVAVAREDAEDPCDEYPQLVVKSPNIGPQCAVDGGALILLLPGYGFHHGKLEFIGIGHDEWLSQQRLHDLHQGQE